MPIKHLPRVIYCHPTLWPKFFSTWQDISCNILVKSSLLNASFRSTFPRTNYYIVLLPNSRPLNSLSSKIHGFISVSKKLLIHGFIRKTPPNSLFFSRNTTVNWKENSELWVHGFQIHGKFLVPKTVNWEVTLYIYGVSICIQSIDIEEKLSSIFEREKD